MTPYKVSVGGSYVVDRTFPGIGQLRFASGLTRQRAFAQLDAFLTRLFEDGRADLVRDVASQPTARARRVRLLEYYAADRRQQLPADRLGLVLDRPLWKALDAWTPKSAAAPTTRRRYAVSVAKFAKAGVLGPEAPIRDLHAVDWPQLRMRWDGSPADWNHLRRALSRFLTMQFESKLHPFRARLMYLMPLAREPEGRVPDLAPTTFWKLIAAAPKPLQATYVTLAVTGMRIGEYLACDDTSLHPHTHQIAVPGSKPAGSTVLLPIDPRMWAWVRAAIPCPLPAKGTYTEVALDPRYKRLRLAWRAACDALEVTDVTLHSLRHCTGQWLAQAGRSEASIQQTLRHRDAGMTRRYTRQVMRTEDSAALADALLAGQKPARRRGKAGAR